MNWNLQNEGKKALDQQENIEGMTPANAQTVLALLFLNIFTDTAKPGKSKAQDWDRVQTDFWTVRCLVAEKIRIGTEQRMNAEVAMEKFRQKLCDWRKL